ncbi:SusC/RagA family TonB-linked outer membrane protein [Flagellimonas olearia]|uniref:SusC/RagA family TonB-linked outer membrane protein n=2 Tax=Flagellimonas olearia TaxID=552546 RepID=A0A6I1E2W6_9FLAO|nr:SusC/RagA family TonB-linked outer membrane protein [Allomuricauda olearia]
MKNLLKPLVLLEYFPKPSLKMKLTALLVLISLFQIHANSYAQNKRISLDMRQVSVAKVIQEIEHKSDFKFLLNRRDVDLDRTVSIQADKEPIKKILSRLFRGTGVSFELLNKQIILRQIVQDNSSSKPNGRALDRKPDQLTISGTITDGNGVPLPGATVIEKGTMNGTAADFDGIYALEVSGPGAVLVFSSLGFTTQEITIGSVSTINVSMLEDAEQLEEVVLVGYGTQKKKDLVGSVSTSSREDFGDVAVSNTSELIQGKMAGVQVVNNSGNPGSDTQIIIRGTGSFTNVAPLYVIDGIQSDQTIFNSLSPYDIEDITVLKDASSVAIYGAQGANGVVIVTTKNSKRGKAQITYNTYAGLSSAWKQFDMLNAAEYTAVIKEWYANAGQPLPPRLQTPEAQVTATDWQDEMFRTGKLTEHHISVGGGSENVKYDFSMGYTNQQSQIVKMDFTRFNVRLNLVENIGKRFRLGQQLNLQYRTTKGVTANILAGLRMPPYISVLDPENELGGYGIATSALDGNDSQNPLIQPNLRDVRDRRLNNYVQLFGEVDLFDGLKFRSQLGVTFNFGQYYNYNPTYAGNQLITQSQINESYDYGLRYIVENFFSYNKTFNNHNVQLTLGNSYRDGGISRGVDLTGSNFANEIIHQIGVAKTVSLGSGYANSNARFVSYFARVNYTLKDRYILSLTGRRDATSLFSKDNRVGYFPAVGLGWKLSEESFLKESSFISNLKLRASWGKTGNSNIPGFLYQSNVWTGSGNSVVYPLGVNEGLVNGATVAIAASPDLKWEETTTFDAGVDASFLNNRLEVNLGYYNRDNEDLLVEVPLPLSTGYGGVSGANSNQTINAASVYNRGVEFSVGYQDTFGELDFGININGAYNKNEVTSLGTQNAVPIIDGSFYSVPAMTRTEVGQPIGSFYGYVYDHVAIDDADVEKYNAIARNATGDAGAVYQSGLLPGDRIFKDLNGDGQLTEEDQTFLGNPIPKWNYGANINLGYKNFDFMLSLQGVADVEIINATKYYLEGMALPFNAKRKVLDRWQNPGDVTDIARIGQNPGTSDNLRNSSWFVEDGSFTRVRNITLGYTVPRDVITKLTHDTVRNARAYFTAQNPFTFTKYSGYDPEISGSNLIFSRGIDTGAVPMSRSFILGLQVSF